MSSTVLKLVEDGTRLVLGENTAEAARQAKLALTAAEAAQTASGSVSAAARYFTSKAAGEAGSATGQFFSYPSGLGGLFYAERTAGGSTIIAAALTANQVRVEGTTGKRTVAIGENAWASEAGDLNVFIGQDAGRYTTDSGAGLNQGTGITVVGALAGSDAALTSDYITAVGYNALRNATAAYCFAGLGLRVGYNIQGGSEGLGGAYITALGCDAGVGITTGKNSTFVGAKSGMNCPEGDSTTPVNGGVTGEGNTGLGTNTLRYLEDGDFNTAGGGLALHLLTTGSSNSAFGYQAGRDMTTSPANCLFGFASGYRVQNITGKNCAFGFNTLAALDTGNMFENAAFGSFALTAYPGARASAFGADCLRSATAGSPCGFGWRAGHQVTTATAIALFGTMAGAGITTAGGSSAFGDYAMAEVNASEGAAFGRDAMRKASGIRNTAVGYRANNAANPFNNTTCIGYNAQPEKSNQTVIGNPDTTETKLHGIIKSTTNTVNTLPAIVTAGVGARAFVTDASVVAAGNFGTVVAGGGTNAVPVYCDGVSWRIG